MHIYFDTEDLEIWDTQIAFLTEGLETVQTCDSRHHLPGKECAEGICSLLSQLRSKTEILTISSRRNAQLIQISALDFLTQTYHPSCRNPNRNFLYHSSLKRLAVSDIYQQVRQIRYKIQETNVICRSQELHRYTANKKS